MGNCLDIPPPPSKKRQLYTANSSYAPGSSVSSIAALMHGSMPPPAPYSRHEAFLPVDQLTGQPWIYPRRNSAVPPPYFQAGHPNMYLPLSSSQPSVSPYGSEDRWSKGYYSDYFIYSKKSHTSHGKSHNNHWKSRDRKGNASQKKHNSITITTFPNPRDDLIKRGSQIIVTSSYVKEHADTVVSGHISASPPSANDNDTHISQQKTSQSLHIPETRPKRGSTYITYIGDDPNPKTADQVQETGVNNASPGFAETGDADGDVIKLLVDEPITSLSPGHAHGHLLTSESNHSMMSHFRSVDTAGPVEPVDVVVCYGSSHGSSEDAAVKIERALDSAGLRVTTAKSGQRLSEKESTAAANAILHAKVLVVLLSLESIKHRSLKDQVSLAHVSGAVLYPVTLGPSLDIITNMKMELKLQLGSYKWTDLSSSTYLDLRLSQVVRSILDELEVIRGYEVIDEDYGQVSSSAQRHDKAAKQRQAIRSIDLGQHISAGHYWDKHYARGEDAVPWDRFLKDLVKEYHELLNCSVPRHCMAQLKEVLKLEMGAEEAGLVRQENFIEFCRDLGTDRDVWEKVHSVAKETSAVRNILSANCTVRTVAINNIVRFVKPSIITTLKKLCTDEQADIRAAATVALSRCPLPEGDHTVKCLLAALDDPNDMVREAGCLAMVSIKDKDALEKLEDLRNNDADAKVRETAGIAISQLDSMSPKTLGTQP
ncbi:unnamed protein product [Lymnaea stagnalis]|uniref:TIR domain-containing protein n=1 Tax=Lymnaea stagnalis TaxID=6523 RepID=A0AAV2HUC7_LYMST